MIGAVVFLIVFILFIFISLVGMSLPPGNWIIEEFISDILQTDFANLLEGIINGVIFGIIVFIIFSIIKLVYDRGRSKKDDQIRIRTSSQSLSIPSSPKILEIEGIGSTSARKLNIIGIKTTDDLLDMGGTKKGRKDISEKTGISETIILEWVNIADLFRIRGIGEEYSDLLNEAGVSTVVELARRNPENLHKTMVGVNEAKKRVRRPPSLSQTIDWIDQAKSLPRRVEY